VSEPRERTAPRRPSKRALAAGTLYRSGLAALLLRLAPWPGVVVLSYHRIGDLARSDGYPGVWTGTQELLDDQLRLLRRRFEILEPGQLRADRLSRRGRRVLITFDDGYRDLYELAHPVLTAHDVRATMFLCTGFIDGVASAWWDEIAWMIHHSEVAVLAPGPWSAQPLALDAAAREQSIRTITRTYWELEPVAAGQMLEQLATATGAGRRPADVSAADWITWEMARALRAAGHEIGSHTVTHPILARLPRARQLQEVDASAQRIEAELGERPRSLAYPVGVRGAFDEHTRWAAAEAGIELAYSNYGGRVTSSSFMALDVRRVSVETLSSPPLFSSTLALPQVFAR
jgi:peptidoglycan/xylan/chitin deacetylase (PgdA/CDA1 family)